MLWKQLTHKITTYLANFEKIVAGITNIRGSDISIELFIAKCFFTTVVETLASDKNVKPINLALKPVSESYRNGLLVVHYIPE